MNITLTERARERGIVEEKILRMEESEHYISCVIYEKRKKGNEVIEELEPAIIFKNNMKHGDYDQVIKMAEKAGLIMLFPEERKFRTDYYGLEFCGYKTMIKSFGYVSTFLPSYRRWKFAEIEKTADAWLEDIKLIAKIVHGIWAIMNPEEKTSESLEMHVEEKNEQITIEEYKNKEAVVLEKVTAFISEIEELKPFF